ncbi:kelch repeat and BTB domain-containing protein 7 [Anguilla anguilla]|uniref:kelch repeat and BTB domain-containing protein 7 n=1 Tax=Anguilla anguilla TaxID=7936 RepID=UPI0015A80AF9|nr:kelch repeat and BTB domain-containing protein 7 [Anguilla anguilla]
MRRMASVLSCFSGPEELEDMNHARSLLKELKLFYDSKLLVDVTIEVDPDCPSHQQNAGPGKSKFCTESGKLFPCNRNVLAAASPYFKSMFTGGLYESKQQKVTIHDVDADSMSLIIDYCYTGKVQITEANVQRLYAAANMLQLEYVRYACSSFMTRRLDVSNCMAILKFADTFDNHDLKSEAQGFVARNFVQLCKTSRELCELDLTQIKDILSLDTLDVDCESKVCSAAIQWIEANQREQTDDAVEVLRCVRWHLFTEKDAAYLEGLKSKPCVKRHLAGFMAGVSGGGGNGGMEWTPPAPAHGPAHRIGRSAKEMILFFGRPNEPFMCYDPYSEEVRSMASPLINLSNLGFKRSIMETFTVCVSPENDLYLASQLSKHFWVYNPVLNSWQELAERLIGRVHADIGYLNGHLYMLGGRDPNTDARLKDVECYSIQRNQWRLVAPLPHSLGKMQIAAMNDRLYVVNKRRMLCYEPQRNRWLPGASLKHGKLHKACVFQDQIFCLCDIPVVKAYSPARGEWRRIGDIPMDSNALNYQVVQHSGRLLLLTVSLAHHNRNRVIVHEYDPARDGWRNVASMLGSSFGYISLSARLYPSSLGSGQSFFAEEDDDSGSSADWDLDGLTDADSDSGSSSSFSDENW